MTFQYLKALHLIFMVTWFAGLFYIVRLFIYHVEADKKEDPEKTILTNQFKLMEKRLWYGITWPSAILIAVSTAVDPQIVKNILFKSPGVCFAILDANSNDPPKPC